jgi:hypothetical protein
MIVKLYTYSGENTVLDKTGMLLDETVKDGTLRSDCNVLKPSIIMPAIPDTFNYMYIPDFGRYYFITEQTSLRNGLVILSGRVDVLYAYYEGIKACPAIAARSANPESQNAYLIDDRVQPYAPQTVCTRLILDAPFSYGASPRYILVTTG